MKKNNYTHRVYKIPYFTVTIFITVLILSLSVFGHGPKGHGNDAFTHFQAVKKGVMLYDQLLSKGNWKRHGNPN